MNLRHKNIKYMELFGPRIKKKKNEIGSTFPGSGFADEVNQHASRFMENKQT